MFAVVFGCESRGWGKFREAGIVNHSISPTNRPHKRRLFRRSDIGCGGSGVGGIWVQICLVKNSLYSRILKGTNAKAKANAVQGLPEIIEIATDKKFTGN